MSIDTGDESHTTASPDEAFAILGNETRLAILRSLGASDEPVGFTDLRKQVGLGTGSEFNYHLEKLIGHFVRKTDEGYELRQPGTRVIEAVLSGVITAEPTLEPAVTDRRCQLCGAPTMVSYREEWVALFCTECDGLYGPPTDDLPVPASVADMGYLGGYSLPPAGFQDRNPTEILETAATWEMSKILAQCWGVCMRCAGPVEPSVDVCENHDTSVSFCDDCGRRFAVHLHVSCGNCPYSEGGLLAHLVISNTDVLSFLTSHGINPISPPPAFYDMLVTHDEDVVSVDPLEVRLTFSVDEDAITVTVGPTLAVEDVVHHSETAND